jgi:hypothetical protein
VNPVSGFSAYTTRTSSKKNDEWRMMNDEWKKDKALGLVGLNRSFSTPQAVADAPHTVDRSRKQNSIAAATAEHTPQRMRIPNSVCKAQTHSTTSVSECWKPCLQDLLSQPGRLLRSGIRHLFCDPSFVPGMNAGDQAHDK